MEMPHLGENCSEETCKKLDFLPMKCDACNRIFCNEHYSYLHHNCPSAYQKDVQVPGCPLCNKPIPVPRGQPPDIAVSAHIDSDCQSDPAKNRRKVFTNRCSMKGCKTKEIVPVLCKECSMNFCLKHRHITDHNCLGRTALRNKSTNAACTRNTQRSGDNSILASIQGTMDEDEALARALALSLQDAEPLNNKLLTQEELDAALARQLQQESSAITTSSRNAESRGQSSRDRCQLS